MREGNNNNNNNKEIESQEELGKDTAEKRRLRAKFLKFWSPKMEVALEASGVAIEEAAGVETDDDLRSFVSTTLTTCAICWENPQNVVFFCKHAACHECHVYLQNCHICRRPIETKIRICK